MSSCRILPPLRAPGRVVCVWLQKKNTEKREIDRGGQIKEIGSLGSVCDGQIKHDTALSGGVCERKVKR